MVQAHDTGPTGVTVDELLEKMLPYIEDLLRRIDGEEFTTNEFIELMLQVPETAAAYDAAGRAWGEQRRQTKMVLHGQVIPGALRRTPLVEWVGYAYGESDEFSIPGLWRLTTLSGE
jgi:hypothetical protein